MDPLRSTHLFIEGLILNLHIGYSEEERESTQPIEISLWIVFPRMPLACVSDELEGTVSCEACIDMMRETAEGKDFHLIEHLAYEIHSALKKQLPMQLELGIRVCKLNPSVSDVKKGISFTYFPQKDQATKAPTKEWEWN